jgi:L-serine dehydratase
MHGIFDLFRIGLGPSSSHTVGPMRAAGFFAEGLRGMAGVARVEATLYGSLAWTGPGHGTDAAVFAGLVGLQPESADPVEVTGMPARLTTQRHITLPCGRIAFDPARDLVLDRATKTTRHPNTMRLRAFDAAGAVLREETWFSIGGGTVLREGAEASGGAAVALPHPFRTARDLLALCDATGQDIATLQLANEAAFHPEAEVRAHLRRVAATMESCIARGMAASGMLPGPLNVTRRASGLAARLDAAALRNARAPTEPMDRASLWAIAVNEENAAGGRVVTAPTNGAAGVVPAVLRWAREYYGGDETDERFLLTAAAIGGLIKSNASVSGAEVGCQGEVGSAAAMAAAGLAAVQGGTPRQVENAAEIALEHHLGMTCDPIGGLVQIPCIERNAMGAVKAIAAASLALAGDGSHKVGLDEAIATMRQTGLDMGHAYKETSLGGLAVHVTEC